MARSSLQPEKALRWGSGHGSQEGREFFAQRVASFARLFTLLFGGIYLVGLAASGLFLPSELWAVHVHPAKLIHLLLLLLGGLIWWGVRRPGCPEGLVVVSDAVLPLAVHSLAAVAILTAPAVIVLGFGPILVACMVLMLRAALVPSPPLRTFLVGWLTTIPLIFAEYFTALRYEPLGESFLTPAVVTVVTGVWCLGIAASTALVSREMYGLRREIAQVRKLGQYTLERLIGEGGMGSVYVAKHAFLRRPTALKLLSPERTGPESIARFEREVQLTSSLTHPNTVAVYDYGRTPDGIFYYAMEYIDGLSLEQLVQRHGPQPAGRVIRILLQAADALAEAHDLGLVHRDIKPANILLCERGGAGDVVKLVDFGLVKDIGPTQEPGLTQTNTLAGTPLYLAPESITDVAQVDGRVDLYALGAVGYWLLSATPPFSGKSVVEVCGHHLHTPPTPLVDRLGKSVPADLEAVLFACLAKQREARPQTASELHDLLSACVDSHAWQASDARDWWRAHRARKGEAA